MTPFSLRIPGKSGLGPRARMGHGNAFTIIELLVAMSVLGLVVFVVAQILNTSSAAISQNTKNVNALDASQAVFQQIGLDISRMVLRNDVDYSFVKNAVGTAGNAPGNDFLSFYARTSGFSSSGTPATATPRALSVVAYQVVQNATTSLLELDYGALQVGWDDTGNNPPGSSPFVLTSATQLLNGTGTLPTVPSTPPASSLFTTLAPEVIRMEICFVLANDPVTTDNPPKLLTPLVPAFVSASNVPLPIQNVAGIIVGIVVIDPKSRLLLPAGVDVKVAKIFTKAVANEDLLSLWTPLNTASALKTAGVPAQAVQGVRIYEKYFPLPW